MFSFKFLNPESTITLIIFTFLFGILTFQLNGSVTRKLSVIALGNLVGLFWNFIFYYFAVAGAGFFGKPFDAFYTIAYPLLNLMWVVPFWSLSLGILPRMHRISAKVP